MQQTAILNPEPSMLIESLRDIGYSFSSALADIIDNSITAKATKIDVFAINVKPFTVAVIDNGIGLSQEELMRSMRLGSTNPRQERVPDDLGRFGLGLKTASFSQCRKLTVVSRKNNETSGYTWDLDRVAKTNSWEIVSISELEEIPYFDNMYDEGTLVLWENVDRLTGETGSGRVNYERVVSEAADHLALVFHRFLSGELGTKRVSIRMNNLVLEPLDPFDSQNKATQRAPEETICPGVKMLSYTLPPRANYSSSLDYERIGLPGGHLKNQGVFLYRAKRLIIFGTWFNLAKKTALTQLSRVRIDIDTNQDEQWKIDVKKVSAQAPEIVRARLKALISTLGAPSKRIYKKRGLRLTSPAAFPTWNLVKDGDTTRYAINREHPVIASTLASFEKPNQKMIDAMLSLIESTFPKDSLFYEISSNEEGVEFPAISDDDLRQTAITFFSTIKQLGNSEEKAIAMMKYSEPFASEWDRTKRLLDIEEQ